jgi:hypothetical protein
MSESDARLLRTEPEALAELAGEWLAFVSCRLCARSVTVFAATTLLAVSSFSQTSAPGSGREIDPAKPPEPNGKRVLWIIPNYRTFSALTNYKPITPKEKLKIAMDDSFDWGTAVLAAALAGEAQLTNSSPSFGQDVEGYSRYVGTAYADILHQDPRYFRRGTGSGWSRLAYAMGQIFWTHTDSGGTQFNFSEIVGNSTAVAISSAYYPEGAI